MANVHLRAPGRVNLIGEHTDYNDGYVLPIAINRGVTLAGEKREDTIVNAYDKAWESGAEFGLESLTPAEKKSWRDYIAGTCWAIQEAGYEIGGANLNFSSNIPAGAGLSSSAALEVAAAAAFDVLYNLKIPRDKLALISQKAENDFVGVKCGIMDQYASALCKENHALFIDCRTLAYQQVPLSTPDHTFLVVNSRVKRSLANSAYNERRKECEEALQIISAFVDNQEQVGALRDVREQDVEKAKHKLPENLYRRSKYVVEENERVLQAVKAMRNNDLELFGKLMYESHAGLRQLYEVSCTELDIIVDTAKNVAGVLGARMTGAGFGGCAIALVHNSQVNELQTQITDKFATAGLKLPEFYLTEPAAGLQVEQV